MPIQYIEMDLRNKTTSEFRTVFHSPLGVPSSQVPLYLYNDVCTPLKYDNRLCFESEYGILYWSSRKYLNLNFNLRHQSEQWDWLRMCLT